MECISQDQAREAIAEFISDGDAKGIVLLGDAFELSETIPYASIDAVITDPPYFLDGMGDTWHESMVSRKSTAKQHVKSLRAGMKFDKKQGKEFQEFMQHLAGTLSGAIKPGGWFASFSAPRLYHRLGVGLEDAGYEIRDCLEWLYTQNQMKAMSVARQMRRELEEGGLSQEEAERIAPLLSVWKTPQMKSCFEPIALAQKPREGTFYENWRKYGVGLVNVKSGVGANGDMSTANVITTEPISEIIDNAFLVPKPTRKEKGSTTHLSVKPLSLMGHLVKILVMEDGLVLDPFIGSGSTGIAAADAGRRFIGFDNNAEYVRQSAQRFLDHGYQVDSSTGFYIVR